MCLVDLRIARIALAGQEYEFGSCARVADDLTFGRKPSAHLCSKQLGQNHKYDKECYFHNAILVSVQM